MTATTSSKLIINPGLLLIAQRLQTKKCKQKR